MNKNMLKKIISYLIVGSLIIQQTGQVGHQIVSHDQINAEETNSDISAGDTATEGSAQAKESSDLNDMTITENLTLSEDTEVDNLFINGGSLNLNGKNLKVRGNVELSNSSSSRLLINKGELICTDYTMNQYSALIMENEEDRLTVNGNCKFIDSKRYSSVNNGTIDVKGDFSVTGESFIVPGNNTVVLSGDKAQTIDFSNSDPYFNILEVTNASDKGVISAKPVKTEVTRVSEKSKINFCGAQGKGMVLSKDTVISGDYNLAAGVINLNGYTLTVEGDLMQTGGVLNVNGGTLNIKGDYRIQSRSVNEDGNVVYGYSASSFMMLKKEDTINIDGDFVTDSSVSHSEKLSAGTMNIGGNFTELCSKNEGNFISTGSHKVKFTGEKEHSISFASTGSYLGILDITDTQVELKNANVYVRTGLEGNTGIIKGEVLKIGSSAALPETVNGNVFIDGNFTLKNNVNINGNVSGWFNRSTLNLNGYAMTVSGDFSLSGSYNSMTFNKGSLICKGNCSPNANITMNSEEDMIDVRGDLTLYNTCSMSAGTIKAGGDLIVSTGAFRSSGSHKVILDGKEKQTVTVTDPQSNFNNVTFANTSEEGIKFVTACQINGNIDNTAKSKVEYFGGGKYGEKLTKDTVIDGEYILSAGVLDLNGYKLTIKGDLLQVGGEVYINGGTLDIEGNYLLQSRSKSEDGKVTYGYCAGALTMQNDADNVNISGDFVTDSSVSHSGKLSAGTMNIGGNFTQLCSKNEGNFISTGSHKVKFTGEKEHSISFASTGSYFGTLDITDTQVELKNANVYVRTRLEGSTGTIKGEALKIGNDAALPETVNGNVFIDGNFTLKNNVNINGNVSGWFNRSTLNLNGYTMTVSGDFSLSGSYNSLIFNKGSLICKGNCSPNANITMNSAEDMIDVRGDLTLYNTCSMSAGTIKAGGDLKVSTGAFRSSGSHKVILDGKEKQTVTVTDPGSYFNDVTFANTSKDGIEFATACQINGNIDNTVKSKVEYYGGGNYGEKLTKDTVIEGEYILSAGVLDLNGFKLTIKGDLIQTGGEVLINGGTLTVEGSYLIENRTQGEEGKVIYGYCAGALTMKNEADIVNIGGDFVTDSSVSHSGKLSAGTMNIGGNFTQLCSRNEMNFVSTGSHKVKFTGEKEHSISFASTGSYFGTLDITDAQVELKNANVYVRTGLEGSTGIIKGEALKIGNDATLPETVNGNVFIEGNFTLKNNVNINGNVSGWFNRSTLNLNGYTMTVSGDFSLSGSYNSLIFNKGSLICKGNCSPNANITMNSEEDMIDVRGDLTLYNTCNMSAGTIKAGGNVKVSTGAFRSSGSHKVILDGKEKQTVTVTDPASYFNDVTFANASEEGIKFATACQINGNIDNTAKSKVEYFGGGKYGEKLTKDTVIEGEYILSAGVLDLNGFKLTVKGDLIQTGGEVIINGGTLTVEGSYLIENRIYGEDGKVTYGYSAGALKMQNDADIVNIGGDFVTDSSVSHSGKLSAGTMNIGGNFTQLCSRNEGNFISTGSHKVKFTGEKEHSISFASTGSYFGTLDITDTQVELKNANVYVRTGLEVSTGTIKGEALKIGNDAALPETVNGNVFIEGNFTLKNNVNINGNVSGWFNRSTLNLNGYTMTVSGDFSLSGSYNSLIFNKGSLICKGNCSPNANITMNSAEDMLDVRGDLTLYNTCSMSAGTIKAGGDLKVSTGAFRSSGSHKVILDGKEKQTVTVTDPGSYFNDVTFANASEEGIKFATACQINGNIDNTAKSKVAYFGGGKYGEKLTKDTVIEGEYVLSAGVLDLNGFKLTVKGDLIQTGGEVLINGGTLTVEGSYLIENRIHGEDGKVTYGYSAGSLKMQNDADIINIGGNFATDSSVSHSKLLSAGTMNIGGNFTQLCSKNEGNFISTGTHKVKFTAKKEHSISFASTGSYFGILDITDTEVSLKNENVYVKTKLEGSTGTIKGEALKIGNDAALPETINGNILIDGNFTLKKNVNINGNVSGWFNRSTLNLNGYTMTVSGNFSLSGSYNSMTFNKGSLICKGNCSPNANITMNSEEDLIDVRGDLTLYNTCSMSAGTIKTGGDLIVSTGAFRSSGSHKVILDGKEKQTVNVTDQGSYFNDVTFANTSDSGIEFTTPCKINGKMENTSGKINVKLYSGGRFGEVLDEDITINEDYVLSAGTLDLNGHKVIINGDFIQTSGMVKINGGTLEVNGDYRIQTKTDDGRNITYGLSSGLLEMKDSRDKVIVNGTFAVDSSVNHSDHVTAGELTVRGNMQLKRSANASFTASGSNTVVFDGDKRQTVTIDSPESTHLANIRFANPLTTAIYSNIYADGKITDETNKLTGNGYIIISDISQLQNKVFSGNINLLSNEENKTSLSSDLTVNNLICSSIYLKGNILRANNAQVNRSLYIDKGTAEFSGNLSVAYSMNMVNAEDYVYVGNNLTISSASCDQWKMTNGILEVKGDFVQTGDKPLVCSENHVVILSRKISADSKEYYQTVKFSQPGTAKFNELRITGPEKNYVVFDNSNVSYPLEKICSKLVKAYSDTEAPSKVTGLKSSDITATSAKISWNQSTDNEGVVGYEVFRDGVKIQTTSGTSITDTRLAPELKYSYSVYAFDGCRNYSEVSEIISVETIKDLVPPEKIQNLKINSRTGSSITVSWSASHDNVGVEDYKVYCDGKETGTTGGNTSYKLSGLKTDKEYTFLVKAVDKAENVSEDSDTVSGYTQMPSIKNIYPNNKSEIGGQSQAVGVYFTDTGNSKGNTVVFEYKDDNDENGEYKLMSQYPVGQSKFASSLLYAECQWDISELNGNYTVRATLYDADNNKAVITGNYTVDSSAAELPESIKGRSENGTAVLTWTPSKSANCHEYVIMKSDTEDGEYKKAASVFGRETARFSDKNVEEGKTYFYKIRTVTKYGIESTESNAVSVSIEKDKLPPQVTEIIPDKTRVNKDVSITVNANDNIALKKIILEYKNKTGDEWILIDEKEVSSDSAEFVWHTGELPDGEYSVRATAEDFGGNRSEGFIKSYTADNTGIQKIEIIPEECSSGSSFVSLRWKDVSESDFGYFEVLKKDPEGNFVSAGTTSTVTGIHIQNLLAQTRYTFKVVGYDNLGNRGIESDEVSVTTTSDTIAPAIKSFYPGPSAFTDKIEMSVSAEDNIAVKNVKFRYSYDEKTWTELQTVTPEKSEKEVTAKYTFDVSSLKEGEIFVEASACDTSDNLSTPYVNKFKIDRTAPAKITDLNADGKSGNVHLTWTATDKDIKSVIIFRSDDGQSLLSKIDDCSSKDYYDTSVQYGKSYTYMIKCVDDAGNISSESNHVLVNVSEDTEKPKVLGFNYENKSLLGISPKMEVVAQDNSRLSKVEVEYKRADSKETVWNSLGSFSMNSPYEAASFVWNTDGMEETNYLLRAVAYDAAGNISDTYQAEYSFDLTAPQKPVVELTQGNLEISVSWSTKSESGADKDISYYAIYSMSDDKSDFEFIGNTDQTSYKDQNVDPAHRYTYKIIAYDKAGNSAEGISAEAIRPADKDDDPPVIIIDDEVSGITNSEIMFDASECTDNKGIVKYIWKTGETVCNGIRAKMVFTKAGDYTVTLTVEDAAGNKTSKNIKVKVMDQSEYGTVAVSVTDTKGVPIPYAYVYIAENGSDMTVRADSEGMAYLTSKLGNHKMAAYKNGYLPEDTTVEINSVGNNTVKKIQLRSGELVTGNLSVHRMSLEEMIEAGISTTAPSNYHTFSFTYELTFEQCPIPTVYQYYCVGGSGCQTPAFIGWKVNGDSGKGNKVKLSDNSEVQFQPIGFDEQTPVLAYIRKSESIRFMKDMFTVDLGVINNASSDFWIDNCYATLDLPYGLSLADLSGRVQKLTQPMGTIVGQENKNVSWYIRGDKAGKYDLSADFSGTLMPFNKQVSAQFKTEESFNVDEIGSGLTIYVYPENAAYLDKPYYVQYALVNESGKNYYNVSTTFGPYEQPQPDIDIKDITEYPEGTGTGDSSSETTPSPHSGGGGSADGTTHSGSSVDSIDNIDVSTVPVQTDNDGKIWDKIKQLNSRGLPMLSSGQSVNFEVFKPGDVMYGTYKTHLNATGDADKVYYRLIKSEITEMTKDMGVKVVICPIPSHVTKYNVKFVPVYNGFGDPVDMTTGAYTDSVPVMTLNCDPAIDLSLDYDSMNCGDAGEFGYGWNSKYETSLDVYDKCIFLKWNASDYATFVSEEDDNDPNVIITDKEASLVQDYIPTSTGLEGYSIRREKDGTYTLSYKNGGKNTFDSKGKLIKVTSANGKETTVTYAGKTKTVKDKLTGVSMTFTCNDDGYVTSVSDNAGRTATIAYKDGCISSVKNTAGNTVHYNYDEKHRVISAYIGDDSEHPFVTNTYDDNNRVISQDDGLESTPLSKFEYSQTEDGILTVTATDRNSTEADPRKVTYVSDILGHVSSFTDQGGDKVSYKYDTAGNLISEKSSIGSTDYTFDENGYMTSVTDTMGNKTSMTYDKAGNIISVTGPKGTISSYTYNEDGLLETVYDKSKVKKSYVYNDNAQMISETVEGLGSKKYTYESGRLASETDYLGNKTTYTYDKYGNVNTITDCEGNKTTVEYDALGRIISSSDNDGKITNEYDARGNLASTVDIRGNKQTNTYDRNDNLIKSVDAKNTVSYTYDGEGHLLTQVNPDGTVFSNKYDRSGQLIETTNENGEVTKYTYDADGNKTSETIVNGKEEYTTNYEYYKNGKLKKVTYPDGTSVTNTYDSSGNLISATDQSSNSTVMEYDKYDNLISQTDAEGNKVSYTYDKYGRILSVTDANGNITKYTEYDANGNCLSQELPNGSKVNYVYSKTGQPVQIIIPGSTEKEEDVSVYFEYDASGRVTKYTDEEGNILTTEYDSSGNITALKDGYGNTIQENTYDILSNLETTKDALGVESQNVYDKAGNIKTVINNINTSRESKSQFTYDKTGRLLTSSDAAEGQSSYTYDQAGNIKTMTDPNGGVSKYNYDSMGRITESITPLGSSNKYSYNAQGLLEESENARNQKTSYTYYKNGWIKSFTDEIGTTEYTYDKNGNVLTVKDGHGSITRKYDCLNHVTEYTDFRGNTVKYAYDQYGRLVTLTYPGGRIVRYEYYKNGNPKSVTDWDNNKTVYEYDKNNRLVKTSRPDGTVETREYNAAGYLVGIKDCKGTTEICARDYSYDEEGNIISVKSTNSVDISNLNNAEMEYDANNQLIKYNGKEVKYDADGNMVYGPLDGSMQNFEYDCRNRLVKAGNTSYEYDAENNRISKTADKTKSEYVIDTTSTLSRVLTAKTGDKTTYFVYGSGLISQQCDKEYYIYHFNNIGSTEAITDKAGNVVERFEYGPYGELLSENKSGIIFLYNGEYGVATDENGLYYMRQRYYNPEIKRFINQDIVVGDIANSPTLNRYAYAQGDPISMADPFGLSPLFNWSGLGHTILDILGFIPGLGVVADVANCIWYLAEGDFENAAFSFVAAIPEIGDAIALGTKGMKISCAAKKIGHMVQSAAKIANGAVNITQVAYKKFVLNEKIGLLDVVNVACSALSISSGLKGFKTTLSTSFCFVAGTLVTTDEGQVPIEEIRKGDTVLSENELTGETEYKEVKETFVNESDELVHVFAGGEEIVCTPGHKFYSPQFGWTSAIYLRAGDILVLSNGEYVVVEAVQHEILESPVKVYNFEVEDYNTYFVGEIGVLTHNERDCDIPVVKTDVTGKSGKDSKKIDISTGKGYDAGDVPVRIDGEWSINDLKQGLLGHPPRGLGSPDIHHGGQMPGAAKHEIIPDQHRTNKALHPNKYNQGVTPEMRASDKQLHWWYRAREQGADQLLPDWIYDD